MLKELGDFKIESGKVRISDPCYTKETWCNGIIENVKNGNWNSHITLLGDDDWGTRVAMLVATDETIKEINESDWKQTDISVGVDSGQAGIYDDKYFKNDGSVIGISTMYKESIPKLTEDFSSEEEAIENNIGLSLNKQYYIVNEYEFKTGKITEEKYKKEKIFILEEREKEINRIKKDINITEVKKFEWGSPSRKNDMKSGDLWYNVNCVNTLGVENEEGEYHNDDIVQKYGGTIPYGVVSRAGYGDGSYTCDVIKKDNEIVAIRIVYISDEEMED